MVSGELRQHFIYAPAELTHLVAIHEAKNRRGAAGINELHDLLHDRSRRSEGQPRSQLLFTDRSGSVVMSQEVNCRTARSGRVVIDIDHQVKADMLDVGAPTFFCRQLLDSLPSRSEELGR
jgi:hypothetical protein